jgi:endonuclease G, mitochondrial
VNITAFAADLASTEQRYADRTPEREELQQRLEEHGILGADSPERVRNRLMRLGTDRETAVAVAEAGAVEAPPPPVPGETLVALERLLGTNDLIGISFLPAGYTAARAVGRIQVGAAGGHVVGFGTGFMVSPHLLLTNNHVFSSADDARSSLLEFNFEAAPGGTMRRSVLFGFEPESFFVTDAALDFSLVAVRQQASSGEMLSDFGWNPLIAQEGKAIVGEFVNIIQHPGGEPKQLALRENKLIDVLPDFLHYETDTAPGSSGSPVFNDQWEVVALHHSGVPRKDADGNILAIGGGRWDPSMGEQRVDWIANEGVRVSRILTNLRERQLDTAQDALRRELVAAASPPTESLPQADGAAPAIAAGTGVVATGGETGFTIPLNVTISVPAAPRAATAAAAATAASPTAAVPAAAGTAAAPAAAQPEDLQAALAEADAARTKPYFDQAADDAARGTYYAGIDLNAQPSELFAALNRLVETTHEPKPRYRPSVMVYPFVDLHEDLLIHSIYSGKKFEPADLIHEDFQIDQQRTLRMQELFLTEATLSQARIEHELDVLEALLPFNCEHVVPQSWFGKQEPMRGDLHHLFALESGCNSFRGNTPYFDFVEAEEVVRTDCGRREQAKFEPTSGKGTVARAVFYFLLRYPREIRSDALEGSGEDLRQLVAERLPTLLEWHKTEPPGLYEHHRNAAIAAVQGNRNPFVDMPELASKVDLAGALTS